MLTFWLHWYFYTLSPGTFPFKIPIGMNAIQSLRYARCSAFSARRGRAVRDRITTVTDNAAPLSSLHGRPFVNISNNGTLLSKNILTLRKTTNRILHIPPAALLPWGLLCGLLLPLYQRKLFNWLFPIEQELWLFHCSRAAIKIGSSFSPLQFIYFYFDTTHLVDCGIESSRHTHCLVTTDVPQINSLSHMTDFVGIIFHVVATQNWYLWFRRSRRFIRLFNSPKAYNGED